MLPALISSPPPPPSELKAAKATLKVGRGENVWLVLSGGLAILWEDLDGSPPPALSGNGTISKSTAMRVQGQAEKRPILVVGAERILCVGVNEDAGVVAMVCQSTAGGEEQKVRG